MSEKSALTPEQEKEIDAQLELVQLAIAGAMREEFGSQLPWGSEDTGKSLSRANGAMARVFDLASDAGILSIERRRMMVLERRAPPARPGSEIDRLRRERDKLSEALGGLVADYEEWNADPLSGATRNIHDLYDKARAALNETKGE